MMARRSLRTNSDSSSSAYMPLVAPVVRQFPEANDACCELPICTEKDSEEASSSHRLPAQSSWPLLHRLTGLVTLFHQRTPGSNG